MKKIFLTIVLVSSFLLMGCSSDEENSDYINDFGCKVCNDFTDSEAVLEVCDNNDNTISVNVSVSGISVYSETMEIEGEKTFSDLDCYDFSDLDF